ncbi:hypothetical protein NBRC116592_09020 [Colwellia sp. KU-HH00111]|uniref:hypothetical protein n=1 Tax=Colwellia sp. KU-HH00111 TaxID=3127652 RepID=UPI00310352D5
MVAFSGLLYFNLIELSLISVSDLTTKKGKVNKSFVMPEYISRKEKSRLVNIGSKGFMIEVINHVIE